MKKAFVLLSLLSFVFGTLCSGSSVETKKNYKLLTMETYMDMESMRGPMISPDGKQIIFSRGWVDKLNDRQRSNLWMTDIQGTRIRELTHGDWRDFGAVWSPDGTKIAFLSNRDGTTQVHVMCMDTREVAQLTHLDRPPQSLRWPPDGTRLALVSFVPNLKPTLPVTLPARPQGAQSTPTFMC